jgi:hypothetical protein
MQTSPIAVPAEQEIAASALAALFPHLSRESGFSLREQTDAIPVAEELEKYWSLAKKYCDSNPMPFWIKHKDSLKNLSSIAFELLAIPASTAAIERGFSSAGLILAGKRYLLGPENLENEVIIKSNLSLLKKYCSFE